MIPLTSEQITARRVELHTVEDQLRTLGRRRSTLRAEILSGYAQPERADARQLSLPVEDKAALDEAASEAVAEVMAKQGKAAKPAPKAAKKGRKPVGKPPAPPAVPTTGHAQQVLRAWIYDRLAHTGPMSIDQLYAAAPAFHREDLVGTVHLLLACELVMEWEQDTYASSENLTGRTIDALVLDNIADALIDEPMTSATLASALSVQHAIVWDLLVELRDQRRVVRQGDLWRLASAQDRTLPILPDVEPAPAREEAAELCPGTAPNTPPTGRPSSPVSPSAPGAAASARASAASTSLAAPP